MYSWAVSPLFVATTLVQKEFKATLQLAFFTNMTVGHCKDYYVAVFYWHLNLNLKVEHKKEHENNHILESYFYLSLLFL